MHLMLWEHENLVDTLSLFSLLVWLTVQSDGCCLLRKRLTFVTTDGSSLAPGALKKVPPSPDLSTTLVAQEKNIHSNSILRNAEGSRRLQKNILSRNPGGWGASAFPQLLKIFLN